MEVKISKEYKDRLFRLVFREKKDLLDLYNAVNDTHYNNADELHIVTLENMLFYDKTFNDKHTLGVTLLQSIQEDKRESVNVAMENLPADNLKYYDLGSGLVTNTIGSSMIKWNMASFMGRINYNYLGRYLLTVSARYDGSSRLAD